MVATRVALCLLLATTFACGDEAPYVSQWPEKCTMEFKNGADIKGCNMVGEDLSNRNLDEIILHNVDLSYANLQGTTFVAATFQDVEFEKAKVQNADFQDATVIGGNLQLAIFCNTTMPAGNIASGNC